MELCHHYCSAESFRLIIESSTFHLSSTHNMNDKGEGEFIRKMLFSEMENLKDSLSRITGDFIEPFEVLKDRVIKEANDRYILCLSKHNDILSQWRGYADDGRGICIGLDMEILGFLPEGNKKIPTLALSVFNGKMFNISEVDYCDEKKAKNRCKAIVRLSGKEISTSSENSHKRFAALSNIMSSLLFSIKHISFQEETEIRLMYNHNNTVTEDNESISLSEDPNYIKDIKFKTRGSYLIPYMELKFGTIKKGLIKEITLGPKNDFHESDLQLFLRANGLEHVEVKRSGSTYR